MEKPARRWAPLLMALALLPLCLVACQAPGGDDAQGKIRTIVISTTVRGTSTAVSPLPPLTIGVWTSVSAPDAKKSVSITIYVICMLQDPTHGATLGPAVGLPVRVRLSGPISQSYTGTTGGDGIMQVHASFTDTQLGKMVTINVTTTWHGATYQGQTYVMPGDTGTPSPSPPTTGTPAPVTSPTSGPEPTATTAPEPTATTAPEPTATTAPEPTATTAPVPTATTAPEPTDTPSS